MQIYRSIVDLDGRRASNNDVRGDERRPSEANEYCNATIDEVIESDLRLGLQTNRPQENQAIATVFKSVAANQWRGRQGIGGNIAHRLRMSVLKGASNNIRTSPLDPDHVVKGRAAACIEITPVTNHRILDCGSRIVEPDIAPVTLVWSRGDFVSVRVPPNRVVTVRREIHRVARRTL